MALPGLFAHPGPEAPGVIVATRPPVRASAAGGPVRVALGDVGTAVAAAGALALWILALSLLAA